MDLFFRAAAAVLLGVVMTLCLGSKGKETGTMLTMTLCAMVLILGFSYLRPLIDFLRGLETLGDLNSGMTGILFKVVGIGILSEIVALICADSGNGALGKTLNLVATVVILWLSIPLFHALLELIQKILGEI